jgi:hypothetical protein
MQTLNVSGINVFLHIDESQRLLLMMRIMNNQLVINLGTKVKGGYFNILKNPNQK